MFQGNPNRQVIAKRRADAERILAILRRLKEGETVQHNELLEAINQKAKDTWYYGVCAYGRRLFAQETGVHLKLEHGIGYKYPTGFEQIVIGTNRIKSGVRRIGRGARCVSDVADDRLPDPKERDLRDWTVGRLKYLAKVGRTEFRALTARLTPTETNPK